MHTSRYTKKFDAVFESMSTVHSTSALLGLVGKPVARNYLSGGRHLLNVLNILEKDVFSAFIYGKTTPVIRISKGGGA